MERVPNKLFNSRFINICLINFIMTLGQQLSNTLLPKFVTDMGAAPFVVGLVTSIFSVSALLVKPVSGQAIDSFDRKKILLFSACVIAASFLGYSLSTNVYMVVVSRLLHGCGIAFSVITCLTMISDSVAQEVMTTAISYYFVTTAVGQALGPQIGLSIQANIGYRGTFISGLLCMLAAILLIFTLQEEKTEKRKLKISLQNAIAKEAVIPAAIMLFMAAVYVNIASFIVLYAESVDINNVGLFFTVNATALLFTRPVIGNLADRFGTIKILPIAISFFGLSMVMISYSTNLYMLLVAAVISAFGYGACQPLIQTMCLKSVPKERRGAASATSYYGTDVGYLLGPLIAGSIIERWGYAMMFRTLPLLLILSLALVFINRKQIVEVDQRSK